MKTLVRDHMTKELVTVEASAPVTAVAAAMRDHDIGAVLVTEGGELAGIVTDRDLAVRVLADNRDPRDTTAGKVATRAPVTLTPEQPFEQAAEIMAEQAVRRLPVVDGNKPVGILSLGDVAILGANGADSAGAGSRDAARTLGEVSAAEGGSTRQAGREEGLPANRSTAGPAGDLPR
jgi:CBS domain-containing protein